MATKKNPPVVPLSRFKANLGLAERDVTRIERWAKRRKVELDAALSALVVKGISKAEAEDKYEKKKKVEDAGQPSRWSAKKPAAKRTAAKSVVKAAPRPMRPAARTAVKAAAKTKTTVKTAAKKVAKAVGQRVSKLASKAGRAKKSNAVSRFAPQRPRVQQQQELPETVNDTPIEELPQAAEG